MYVAAFLEMGIKGEDCGSTFQVHPRNEYTIKAYGDFAGSICSYTFMGQVKENCLGLCYNMNNESFFKDSAVELILQAGPHIQVSLLTLKALITTSADKDAGFFFFFFFAYSEKIRFDDSCVRE